MQLVILTQVVGVLCTTQCALLEKPAVTQSKPMTHLYSHPFDLVWDQTLAAITDYPLRSTDKDAGRIQTELITGPYNEVFMSLPEPLPLPERYRFTVRISMARLETEDKQPLTRVRVLKNLEQYFNFYVGWRSTPSDDIEEKALLYRIEHLCAMSEYLPTPAKNQVDELPPMPTSSLP